MSEYKLHDCKERGCHIGVDQTTDELLKSIDAALKCLSVSRRGFGRPAKHQPRSSATGMWWWCAEHYDRWHDIGMCLHADGTMPSDGLPPVAAKGGNG